MYNGEMSLAPNKSRQCRERVGRKRHLLWLTAFNSAHLEVPTTLGFDALMFAEQLCSPPRHHVNAGDPTSDERGTSSEAAIGCFCSETKCQLLPTLALRASFEEDFCRIIFPMLEINSKFFQAHHEGKVLGNK